MKLRSVKLRNEHGRHGVQDQRAVLNEVAKRKASQCGFAVSPAGFCPLSSMKLRSVKLRNEEVGRGVRRWYASSMKLRSVKLRNQGLPVGASHAVESSMKLRSVKLRNAASHAPFAVW